MSPDFAVQVGIRARLIATPVVTNLVPATSILDVNQRPAPDPSIIIGEGQTLEGERLDRRDQRVFMDLHCWKKELGLVGVKAIAGAVRSALHSGRLTLDSGFHCADCRVSNTRFLRDPDGEHGHAIVTVETLVCEVAS